MMFFGSFMWFCLVLLRIMSFKFTALPKAFYGIKFYFFLKQIMANLSLVLTWPFFCLALLLFVFFL